MVPFFILPGIYQQFEERLPDSYLMLTFGLASVILWIWGFVEMYCLKGTSWPNRFGPNRWARSSPHRAASVGRPGGISKVRCKPFPTELAHRRACMLSGGHDRCPLHRPRSRPLPVRNAG